MHKGLGTKALLFGALMMAAIAQAAPPDSGGPPTSVNRTPRVDSAKLTPWLFLTNIWYGDPVKDGLLKGIQQGSKWTLSGLSDLNPPRIHLVWLPNDSHAAKIADIVAGHGYVFELHLNGTKLKRGPKPGGGDYYLALVPGGTEPYGCPSGKTCLGTTIVGSTWFGTHAPWTVKLRLASPKRPTLKSSPTFYPCPDDPTENCARKPDSSVKFQWGASATIKRGAVFSYFEKVLYPTFQHPRCSTCHSLGSAQALRAQHKKFGNLLDNMKAVATGHGTVFTCASGCHHTIATSVPGTQFTEVEWKAPGFDMGIRLSGRSPKDICNTVVAKLKTAHAMKTHFHADARIGWAVQSGKVLGVKKPVAPPKSYSKWVEITNRWIDGGFPCPK